MKEHTEPQNPWTSEDEKEHFPSVMEWWAIEAFFKEQHTDNPWSIKIAMTEWFDAAKNQGSIANMTLFNQQTKQHTIYIKRDDVHKLTISKETNTIQFEKSTIQGTYPKYHIHFMDPKHNIETEFELLAQAYPHWVAQDITNGWLPMGLGFYRYGFIPRMQLTGTLKHNNHSVPITGTGYYEHVWGDFDFDNPLQNITNVKKTLQTYVTLIEWWLSNNKIRIPNTISFATENNPFGYDWVWGLCDNGWSLFYGNIMFWIMDGPVMGSLMLTKDGKTYEEFSNITFHYLKTRFAKDYDFLYPTEFEITAKKDQETIYLRFTMTSEPREYINEFPFARQLWTGLAICESPGTFSGYHYDGTKKTPLQGICKIEPQRQISKLGHNTLKIDITKPPKGVGFDIEFHSHYLKKRGQFQLQLLPKPQLHLKLSKINPKIFNNKYHQPKFISNI